MNSEKRGRQRVDFSITVLFETTDNRKYHYDCSNVSMSGFFLETISPLPLKTAGRFQLLLESGIEQLLVIGEAAVVRIVRESLTTGGQPGMGLQITKLDPDSSINLYNIIKYQHVFDE